MLPRLTKQQSHMLWLGVSWFFSHWFLEGLLAKGKEERARRWAYWVLITLMWFTLQLYYTSFFLVHLLWMEPSRANLTKAHHFPQAPSKCSPDSWYFDCRSQLKNFRNKQLWENCIFITYSLDVFQLHNTNMRRNTPEKSFFLSSLLKKSILNINACNHACFIGAKINGFFSSYIIVFNSTCSI